MAKETLPSVLLPIIHKPIRKGLYLNYLRLHLSIRSLTSILLLLYLQLQTEYSSRFLANKALEQTGGLLDASTPLQMIESVRKALKLQELHFPITTSI